MVDAKHLVHHVRIRSRIYECNATFPVCHEKQRVAGAETAHLSDLFGDHDLRLRAGLPLEAGPPLAASGRTIVTMAQ